MGANVFNMALAGVAAGYIPYYFLGTRWKRAALFSAGFCSVMASSLLALGELNVSGVPMPAAVTWFSLALFTASALAEGIITLAVVQALEKMNPAWVREPKGNAGPLRLAIASAAVLLAAASAFAVSTQPDGIGRLALSLGIDGQAYNIVSTPFSGYEWQAGSAVWVRKLIAGFAGLAFIYCAVAGLGRLLVNRRSG
jgi:hypothetical protein